MLVSGQVEMRRFGMAKIYKLTERVPLSALLSISSELVIQLDSSLRVIYANEPFLLMAGTDNKSLLGKNIEFTSIALVFEDFFTEFIQNLGNGIQGKEWSGEILLRSKNITWFCRIAPTVFDDGRKGVSVILEDITERKLAESSLRESEDRFRKLIEISPDGVFIHQHGKIIFINPAALKILGASQQEDIIGKFVLDIIHPDFRQKVKKNIEMDLSGEITPPLELHMIRQDGATIIVEGRGVKTTIDGIPAVQVAIRDITDRKRIELELRESEAKYRTFIDRANDGIVVVQDGIIKICNRSTAKFWGGSIEEIIGKNFMEFIHPDVLPDIVNRYKQRIAGEKISPLYETILKRKDGSSFFAELNAGLIALEGETADLVIIRDINDRKKIEERLHKSENLYRTLAEASNDLIFIIDRNDRVEYVNSFASKMVNKTPQQIIGQSRSSLFPPDVVEQQKKALKEVFDKGIPFRSEGALIFGDYIHWYDHYLKPLMDADNNVRAVLGISRDITERKNIEKKLLEGRELYQHLLEQSFDAIAIHKEGKIASVNEKAARILGAARPEDLEGKSIFEFIHPDSCKDLEDRLQKLTNDLGMIVPVIIEKFIRTDGSTVIVEVFATSFDDNGTPAFRVAFREITSQCIS
jgi:PAS domain S-box-containing protein